MHSFCLHYRCGIYLCAVLCDVHFELILITVSYLSFYVCFAADHYALPKCLFWRNIYLNALDS